MKRTKKLKGQAWLKRVHQVSIHVTNFVWLGAVWGLAERRERVGSRVRLDVRRMMSACFINSTVAGAGAVLLELSRPLHWLITSSCRYSRVNVMALELRPNCECCDRDLPPASTVARICSYECTFCAGLRRQRAFQRLSKLRRWLCPPANPPGDRMANRAFHREAATFGQARLFILQS